MTRVQYYSRVLCLLLIVAVGYGCSTRKNTSSSRFYHRLTTRYNVYYNGQKQFSESYSNLIKSHTESYSEPIFLDPIEAQRGVLKETVGGAFDKALEKGQKAIKMHSIRVKPERKRNASPKDEAFYRRREYNTFLHNAWLLVGKSQFYNGDFMNAMATFSYMSRLYATEPLIRDEARLWQARSYVAMDWLHEGETLVAGLQTTQSLQRKSAIYDKTKAEIALALGKQEEAIEPLRRAIRKEPDRIERMRMRYLLGQLQMRAKRNREADRTFATLLRQAPPFAMEIATHLRRVEIEAQKNPRNAIRSTQKLARNGRNKNVFDRIYLTQGQLYLMLPDTLEAIKALRLGGEKSTERKEDYALCQITLGYIYRAQRNWLEAQKAFAAGAPTLPQKHPLYDDANRLSKQLDALGLHVKSLVEQDSLRHLASLPEEERFRIIDSAITAYKRAEKERMRNEQMAEQEEKQRIANEEMGGLSKQSPGLTPAQPPTVGGEFYFYNPQLIAQGKAKFVQLWGQRPLEDDWRRRRKQIAPTAESNASPTEGEKRETTDAPTAETPEGEENPALAVVPEAEDPKQRAYYLAQLPLTEEQMAASDIIIQNALSGMAQVFENEMGLYQEAIEAWEELLRRYPDYNEKLTVYYQLYMLCERVGERSKAAEWQRNLVSQYPEEPLAKAVSDPNYISKLRSADSISNDIYKEAWLAYRGGEAPKIRLAMERMKQEFPLSELLPKMYYLNALSYVLEGNQEQFKKALEEMIALYPQGEASEPAQRMLSELLRGRKIAQGGYTGLQYDALFGGEESGAGTDSLYYALPLLAEKHKVVLLYPAEEIDRNTLLFAITTFNFSQFTDQDLSLSLERGATSDRLLIGDFKGEFAAWQYVQKAYSPKGYMTQMGGEALLFAISERNWEQLQKGLSLEAYMNFMADSIAERSPTAAIPLERYANLKLEAEQQAQQADKGTRPTDTPEEEHPSQPLLPTLLEPSKQKEKEPITETSTETEQSVETPEQEEVTTSTETTAENDKKKIVSESKPISYDDVRRLEKERKMREKQLAEEKKKRERAVEEARRQALREREKKRQEERRKRAEAEKERRNKARAKERTKK